MPGDSPITADMIADHGSASYQEGRRVGIAEERARCAEIAHAIEEDAELFKQTSGDDIDRNVGRAWQNCAAQVRYEIDHGMYAKSEAARERERIVAELREPSRDLSDAVRQALADDYEHPVGAVLATLADHLSQGRDAVEATSPALNEPCRSRHEVALGVAISAIRDYLDGNYENPRRHRPSKCSHGLYYYAICENCIDAHFTAASNRIATILGEPAP